MDDLLGKSDGGIFGWETHGLINGLSRIRFIGGTYTIYKAYFSGLCK